MLLGRSPTQGLFFQAEGGIRDYKVTGVQTCALPITSLRRPCKGPPRGANNVRRRPTAAGPAGAEWRRRRGSCDLRYAQQVGPQQDLAAGFTARMKALMNLPSTS